MADPTRMKHAEKVQVRHDAEITAKGSKFRHMVRVEVHLKDGTKMERTVEAGRGNENNFASEADVVREIRETRDPRAAATAGRAVARRDVKA